MSRALYGTKVDKQVNLQVFSVDKAFYICLHSSLLFKCFKQKQKSELILMLYRSYPQVIHSTSGCISFCWI